MAAVISALAFLSLVVSPGALMARSSDFVDASSITDKVICGYQGWFNCAGDGSPLDLRFPENGWRHWSQGQAPAPGRQTFELYPAVDEYPWDALYPTDFSPLGSGDPAELFSSFDDQVIDVHFRWMRDYGLDGVALQRFGVALRDPLKPSSTEAADNRNAVALKVREAAERYGRVFYIMYDVSGMSAVTTKTVTRFSDIIKTDWANWVTNPDALALTASPQYAHQDGHPVVGLWGIGFKDRPDDADQFRDLIDWFKMRGCYVVGGVPRNWQRSLVADGQSGFREAYRDLDMIVPWTVGTIKTDSDVVFWYWKNLLPNRLYCLRHGIDYAPVIYPGFSWSNWHGGEPNQVPRRAGALFWALACAVQKAGLHGAYIAMFDEYDEATAIAKAATDSSMIPQDQYFLTLSADGTFVSSDFYLRLAGRMSAMLKGRVPPTPRVPIPLSTGPVFFRSSLERGLDPLPAWQDRPDFEGGGLTHVIGSEGRGDPVCHVVSTAQAASGSQVLEIAGRDNDDALSFVYFKVFDVNIPVTGKTRLSYRFFPENERSRYVAVDLVMTDGSTLRDSGSSDEAGVNIHPDTGHGRVGRWTRIEVVIGRRLKGKVIDRILVGYDHGSDRGDFKAFIDDLVIDTPGEAGAPR